MILPVREVPWPRAILAGQADIQVPVSSCGLLLFLLCPLSDKCLACCFPYAAAKDYGLGRGYGHLWFGPLKKQGVGNQTQMEGRHTSGAGGKGVMGVLDPCQVFAP